VDEHAAFMDALAQKGVLLFAGPLAGTEHGRLRVLLVADAKDEAEIHRHLADDPWLATPTAQHRQRRALEAPHRRRAARNGHLLAAHRGLATCLDGLAPYRRCDASYCLSSESHYLIAQAEARAGGAGHAARREPLLRAQLVEPVERVSNRHLADGAEAGALARRARVDLAAFLAVALAERFERDQPLVELLTADCERVPLLCSGPAT
jgi:uncharacterized protein YciI